MSTNLEKRLSSLETAFKPRDDRGCCPNCGKNIWSIIRDADGVPHCGGCKAVLAPEDVPRNVKSYGANIDDGDETTGD